MNASTSGSGELRRILIVAYYYPPLNVIGSRRPYSLAKWLTLRGHRVTVLTSRLCGSPGNEPWDVVSAPDLLDSGLNWRRGQGDLETVAGRTTGQISPSRWADVFVPDIQLFSWLAFAAAASLRLSLAAKPDVVITTSPVASSHLVGLLLSRAGVPWIADLRDGWRFEPPRRDWPFAVQRWFDGALESLVVRRANAVVTVTDPLVRDLEDRYSIAAHLVTNGFDPDDEPSGALIAEAPVSKDRLTFVHTGGAGMDATKTLEPILKAVKALGAESRIEVIIAGAMSEYEAELYSRPDYSAFVRHLGFKPRHQALALQRAADWLVLATSGNRRSEASGKLFEYLAASRPILLLGDDCAAADIVRSTGTGEVIPVQNQSAAETLLARILESDPSLKAPSASAPDEYLWPNLSLSYEEIIEEAIMGAPADRLTK